MKIKSILFSSCLALFTFKNLFAQTFTEAYKKDELKKIFLAKRQLKRIINRDSILSLQESQKIKLYSNINTIRQAFLLYKERTNFYFDTAQHMTLYLLFNKNDDVQKILAIAKNDTLMCTKKITIGTSHSDQKSFTENYDYNVDTLLSFYLTKSFDDLKSILKTNRIFDDIQLVVITATRVDNEYDIKEVFLNPFIYQDKNKLQFP